jgi:hypothetical protein
MTEAVKLAIAELKLLSFDRFGGKAPSFQGTSHLTCECFSIG